jgi:hypothetical protein
MVNATPRPICPWERLGNHSIGGWVDPRASLEVCGKSRPQLEFDPRTFQPVASRYTDNAIPDEHKILLASTRIRSHVCRAMPPHLTIAGNKKRTVEWTNKQKHHGVAWSRPSVITTLL